MQKKSKAIIIITLLFTYIVLQFLWWEIVLVKQANEISNEKQKIIELTSSDDKLLKKQINELHEKKQMRIYMIAGEGTVFLLLLLFGVYKVNQYHKRETELIQQQNNFILSVTHELKTPIAATKLQLQTLQKHKLDDEKKQELLSNALNETERLNKLIDNVLLASRLDGNALSLTKENINVSDMITHVTNTYFKSYIEKKELYLFVEPGLFLKTDKIIFPSLIINLIENAIKYSFEKINVSVNLKKENGFVKLIISDTGKGIDEKEKLLIFNKFYRSGNEEVRSTKGTGLGLYIVKNICDAHNGKIYIQNNNPSGSVFYVEFDEKN